MFGAVTQGRALKLITKEREVIKELTKAQKNWRVCERKNKDND